MSTYYYFSSIHECTRMREPLRKWQCGSGAFSKATDECRKREALGSTPQHCQLTSAFSSMGLDEEDFSKGRLLGSAYHKPLLSVFRTKDRIYTDSTCANAQQSMAVFSPCVTDNTGKHRFHLVPLQSRAPNVESSLDAALRKIIK